MSRDEKMVTVEIDEEGNYQVEAHGFVGTECESVATHQIFGTPQQCIDQLRVYVDALQPVEVNVVMRFGGGGSQSQGLDCDTTLTWEGEFVTDRGDASGTGYWSAATGKYRLDPETGQVQERAAGPRSAPSAAQPESAGQV